MLSYHGGRKDCLWLKENMSVVHVQRLVKEVLGEGLKGRQMWYNMKYDRREVLLLGKDVDVTKLINRNEEYAYIYVGGEEKRYLFDGCMTMLLWVWAVCRKGHLLGGMVRGRWMVVVIRRERLQVLHREGEVVVGVATVKGCAFEIGVCMCVKISC